MNVYTVADTEGVAGVVFYEHRHDDTTMLDCELLRRNSFKTACAGPSSGSRPFLRTGSPVRVPCRLRTATQTRAGRLVRFCLSLCFCGGLACCRELQTFQGARLIDDPSNDGDSFLVAVAGKRVRVRLYYVDCPETNVSSDSDARRVREQRRYFGLGGPEHIVRYGQEAARFTARVLAQPFTVHTAFANALGRSAEGRVYGFVTTADGADLGTLLVREGLARARGVGRATPDGVNRDEMKQRLADVEVSAVLRRAGVWSDSVSERIAELRATQRREEAELRQVQKLVQQQTEQAVAGKRVDLNTCTLQDLEGLPGVGATLARRIVTGRPYSSVDDLLKVKRLGAKLLERLKPMVTVGGGGEP